MDIRTAIVIDEAISKQLAAEIDNPDLVLVSVWLEPERRVLEVVETECHDCGTRLTVRPYAMPVAKKVCIECAVARADGGSA